MNPIFQALMGNPLRMLQEIKQNPLGFLRQKGFNVPENINDPNAIIQHLMNSRQISQAQYEQARQIAHNLKF